MWVDAAVGHVVVRHLGGQRLCRGLEHLVGDLGRGDGRRVGEHRDAPMATSEQVIHRHEGPQGVVDHDRIGVHPPRAAVGEDDGEAGADLGRQVVLTGARRHEHESVDTTRDEVFDRPLLAQGRLVQTGGHEHDLVRSHGVLEGTHQRGREAIGKVLNEHPDHAGSRAGSPQVARREVVSVVEILGGGQDPVAHVAAHSGLGVDDPGHGLDADASGRGDVAHGRALTRSSTAVRRLGDI